MRGERVTTDMHRLDHGDRATPHHGVAWMACPWWGLVGQGPARLATPRGCVAFVWIVRTSLITVADITFLVHPSTCTQMILHASEHCPASLFRNCPACTHPVPACAVCLGPIVLPHLLTS